ncbi:alcohol dehydrogenase catalytic domain-containing protein [Nocardioides humi]|uniref:NAD(P)-dependent alcohol dehydrogenase n=1 Tax=Nocardioides humi TaxID=449461 RepID=A0ABN2ACU3_9ACTN|nr:zinc-binding dehydrogenase [Nocardioides humi]
MSWRATAALARERTGELVVEEIELRDPRPGELLVRIAGVGFCHSDLMFRRTGSPVPLPVVLGHEGAGVVEAVGPGVSAIAPGDHVVLSFDSCGGCESCGRAMPAYCARFRELNAVGTPPDGSAAARDSAGGAVGTRWFGQSSFASYAVATARNAVRVDRDLPLELLGPLGCGLLTGAGTVLNHLRVPVGSSVAVVGTGAVGMAAVMAAAAAGAERIVAVDLHPGRLELAAELGATHCVLGDQLTPATGRELLGRVDHAVDTSGAPQAILAALAALGPGGRLALVGTGTGPVPIDPSTLAGRQVGFVVEGEAVPQTFIPELLALWREGSFPFERLVTTYALDDVARAEVDLTSGRTVKPVLVPAS